MKATMVSSFCVQTLENNPTISQSEANIVEVSKVGVNVPSDNGEDSDVNPKGNGWSLQ